MRDTESAIDRWLRRALVVALLPMLVFACQQQEAERLAQKTAMRCVVVEEQPR